MQQIQIRIVFQRQLRKQKKAVFVPNTFVETSSAKDDVDIAVLFEGVEHKHEDLTKFHIINQIIGSWSSGGPGKGMRSRSTLNLMQKVACVEQAGGVFQTFTDCGIFGMRVGGPQNTGKQLYECLIQEIRNLLVPMSDEEFERSKNISNTLIQINLEKQADKLEESVKNIFNRGTPNTEDYYKQVSSVTKDQIHETIRKVLFTPPTVMFYGQKRERIPDNNETSKYITQ